MDGQRETDQPPPAGYRLYTRPSPLLDAWRPIWMRDTDDRVLLAVEARVVHCNSRGTVHGGFYAALADQAMGLTASARATAAGLSLRGLLTTSIAIDYVAPAKVGQWLVFDTYFAVGSKASFLTEIDITSDGKTVARGRASFRVKLADG